MGGDITVDSQVGVGTRFTVTLPCETQGAGDDFDSELSIARDSRIAELHKLAAEMRAVGDKDEEKVAHA